MQRLSGRQVASGCLAGRAQPADGIAAVDGLADGV